MPRDFKATAFCFTVNNYSADDIPKLKLLEKKYLIVGRETGENGTPHLQGYVHFGKQVSAKRLRDVVPRAHIEKARGSPGQNRDYCSKGGDFEEDGDLPGGQGKRNDLAKMWEMVKEGRSTKEIAEECGPAYSLHRKRLQDMKEAIDAEEQMAEKKKKTEDVELREWQKIAKCRLEEQGDRKILFVVDERGNHGKTFLANYLWGKGEADVFESTCYKDVTYAYTGKKIVIFDLTRTAVDHVNYGTIEAFKNGRIFISKYMSTVKPLDNVKVAVFMNTEPDYTKLSEDRYDVQTL